MISTLRLHLISSAALFGLATACGGAGVENTAEALDPSTVRTTRAFLGQAPGPGEPGQEPPGFTSNPGPNGAYVAMVPISEPNPSGAPQHVLVTVRPENTAPAWWEWDWIVGSSDNELRHGATLTWYAQASCPDDLVHLSVSGPGGTLIQNPLMNPIWGYFDYQSFSINTLKNLCLNWVNSIGCDPLSPMCPLYADYVLTGGVAPASATDVVRIRGRCASGTTMERTYAGTLSVRCSRDY